MGNTTCRCSCAASQITFVWKSCLYYTCETDNRCQFHQCFTRAFFVRMSFWQLFSSYIFSLEKVQKHFSTKNEHVKCWWNLPQVAAAKYMSVGVASLTARIGCESKLPNVYTRVDYYLKWIEKETGIMIKP